MGKIKSIILTDSEPRLPHQNSNRPFSETWWTVQEQVYNLTLCIPARSRIACFRPTDWVAPKNGTKISSLLCYNAVAKSIHFKWRSHPPFPARKVRWERPPFLPHASYRSAARVPLADLTRGMKPSQAWTATVFMRHLFSKDPPFSRKQGLSRMFIPYLCSFRFYLGSFEKRGCQHIKGKSCILTAKCGICVHVGSW